MASSNSSAMEVGPGSRIAGWSPATNHAAWGIAPSVKSSAVSRPYSVRNSQTPEKMRSVSKGCLLRREG